MFIEKKKLRDRMIKQFWTPILSHNIVICPKAEGNNWSTRTDKSRYFDNLVQ